jgi:hypothetical protein
MTDTVRKWTCRIEESREMRAARKSSAPSAANVEAFISQDIMAELKRGPMREYPGGLIWPTLLVQEVEAVDTPCDGCEESTGPHAHLFPVAHVSAEKQAAWPHRYFLIVTCEVETEGDPVVHGEPERKTPCTRFLASHDDEDPRHHGYCLRCGHPLRGERAP